MSYSKSRGRSSSASMKSSRSVTSSSVGNPQESPSNLETIQQQEMTNELLQTSKEQKNLLSTEEKSENQSTFVPWRVFVNQIDSYHGKKLAETLPGRDYDVDSRGQGSGILGDGFDPEGNEKENQRVTRRKRNNVNRTRNNQDNEFPEDENTEGRENEINSMDEKIESRKLEVVGTVKNNEYERPEEVSMIIGSSKNKEQFLEELMKCGVVIYDITQDDSQITEARWAFEGILEKLENLRRESPREFELSRDRRYFILISTVMTWALTKPLNPEEPDLPFTEADYRKRRPHPNFKEHIKCERDISTMAKRENLHDKLKTVVIGSGITYGEEEGPIHDIFKMAWQNAEYLPILGRGNNKIPLLHVRDLVEVVCMLVKKWPKQKYIVAVEQELVTQATIIKKISKALTTGKVKRIKPEEAFLLKDVTQRSYDILNANINIEPAYVVDNGLQWHLDLPFRDNLEKIVDEYKTSRKLATVNIVVMGPPASGKTKLAQSLAKHYGIHYINVKNLIEETIEQLRREVEVAGSASGGDVTRQDSAKRNLDEIEDRQEELMEEEEVDENEEEVVQGLEASQQLLDEIRNSLAENNGRLIDDILNKIFRRRLLSNDCQNQGYVIDGYPKTFSQAKDLFGFSDEEEDIDDEEDDDFVNSSVISGAGKRNILPELVVVLEACDEFLIERVVKLPEIEIQGTHYNEEGMLRRLKEYRERNTDDDENPQQFFHELEIHPIGINIESDICPEIFSTLFQCIKKIGEPRNYGPTDVERKAEKKRIEAEALAAAAIEEARKKQEILERKITRERKMMEWTDLLEKLKQEEAKRLSVIGEPLRQYLVKYIFPTLSQGLIEVAKLRPTDPIDFLAEYLFKENPSGKMFEPDYTETMSMLLSAIEKFQEGILPESDLNKGITEKYLKRQGYRVDDEVSCRRTTTDEVLTEEDEDDDSYRTGCDGKERRATTDRIHDVVSSITTANTTNRETYQTVRDSINAVAASSFSYEDIEEGSKMSFGNLTILSRENSQ